MDFLTFTWRCSEMETRPLTVGSLHFKVWVTKNCPLVHSSRQLSWRLHLGWIPSPGPVCQSEWALFKSQQQTDNSEELVWGSLGALLKISEAKLLHWQIRMMLGNWPSYTHTHTHTYLCITHANLIKAKRTPIHNGHNRVHVFSHVPSFCYFICCWADFAFQLMPASVCVCVFDYTCSFRLAWGKLLSVLSGAVRDITTTHTYTLTSTCGNSSELPNTPPSDSPLCERQAHFPTQWLASRLKEPAHSIEPLANACAHTHTHAQTKSIVIPSLTNTQPILTEPRLSGKVY